MFQIFSDKKTILSAESDESWESALADSWPYLRRQRQSGAVFGSARKNHPAVARLFLQFMLQLFPKEFTSTVDSRFDRCYRQVQYLANLLQR